MARRLRLFHTRWPTFQGGWSARPYWLVWASSDYSGEEKFFLSNAPAGAGVALLVGVASRRFYVGHGFRLPRGEPVFGSFEGRSYGALLRHLTLYLVAMSFVAEHAERLRGEKSELTLEQFCRALHELSRAAREAK